MKERPILFSAPMVHALLGGTKTQTRRIVKPGRGQSWLTADGIAGIKRFAPSVDGWWTMAVGAPRRIVHCGREMDGGHVGSVPCPYGVSGDRLWVRETWGWGGEWRRDSQCMVYRADDSAREVWCSNGQDTEPDTLGKPLSKFEPPAEWRPSIFMPRWASRITLEIAEVRVERLQSISEADARAEGVEALDTSGIRWRHYGPTETEGDHASYEICARDSFESLWRSINGADSWNANPWVWVVSFKRIAQASRAA